MRQLPEALFALAQSRLGLLARRDVVEKRDLVLRLAGGAALDHHGERYPDDRAVLAQVALLDAHRIDLPGIQAGALRVDHVDVLGMRDLPAREAQQLVLGIARHFAQAPVDPDKAPVHADVRDPRPRQLEGAPEPLLALAQRSRGALRLGDVLHHRDEVARLAAPAAHQRARDSHPDARAVLAQQLLLAQFAPGDFAGDEPAAEIEGLGEAFRRVDVAQAHRRQLLLRVAENLAVPVVDPQVTQVKRQQRDTNRGLIERRPEHLLAFAQRLLHAPALGDVAVDAADARFSLCRPWLTAHPRLPKQRVAPYHIVRSCASRGV